MIIGHQKIRDFLMRSADSQRLAHAYIFAGPAEIGKKELAIEIAEYLLCQEKKNGLPCGKCRSCLDVEKNSHPDVFILSPRREEKKNVVKTFEIGINETRSLCHQLSLSPYSSSFKIAIIDEADKMTNEAVNSFLKTLEEPTPYSLIFLITSKRQMISGTVISRCQTINFFPAGEKEILLGLKKIGFDNSLAAKAAKLSAGRPGRAIRICRDERILESQQKNFDLLSKALKSDLCWRMELAREMAQNIPLAQETLSQWLLSLRDKFLSNAGCNDLILGKNEGKSEISNFEICRAARQIQKAQTALNNSSFDSKLALEVMMMKI